MSRDLECSTCPRMNLNGWRGALGGISSCCLVFTGDHLHPSLSALLLTQQILLETSLCQVCSQHWGCFRECVSKCQSRTGPWRQCRALDDDGTSLLVFLITVSFSSSKLQSMISYLRFQSRLPRMGVPRVKCSLLRLMFRSLPSQPHFVQPLTLQPQRTSLFSTWRVLDLIPILKSVTLQFS